MHNHPTSNGNLVGPEARPVFLLLSMQWFYQRYLGEVGATQGMFPSADGKDSYRGLMSLYISVYFAVIVNLCIVPANRYGLYVLYTLLLLLFGTKAEVSTSGCKVFSSPTKHILGIHLRNNFLQLSLFSAGQFQISLSFSHPFWGNENTLLLRQ